jgi:signal transduction histidine kinase
MPPGTAQRLAADRAFLGRALRTGSALGNVQPGTPSVIETAVAFQTPSGPRLQVNASPAKLFADFLGPTLRPLPTLRGSQAFVLDAHDASLGSIDWRGGRPAPPPGLARATRTAMSGTYNGAGGRTFVAATPIAGSPWKIALAAPESQLYASARGFGRWAPWVILLLGAAAVIAAAVLMRRLASANAELDASRRRLELRAIELERSNEDLEQFAYAASHDLSEPLRTVAGFSQLLRTRYAGRLDDEADEFITHMVGGVQRMQQLIDDLLLYSRVGREPAREEDVDLEDVLSAVLSWIAPTIDERRAQVTHDPLPIVRGERGQIAQVMQNLVSNAVKFTSPDTTPEVHVSAERQNHAWRIGVRDNGIGVKGGTDVIFKMFGRLHGVDTYPGTGIGLALAKRIVEGHGGRIWVEAAPGGGSVFYFTLPAGKRARRAPALEVSA